MTTKNREKNNKFHKASPLYTLGLDIGTTSVGFTAIDEAQRPMRAKGKTVIGVRLFQEGQSAVGRKNFRTTRRRLKRRRRRLNLLKQFFSAPLRKIDPTFFKRLKASSLSPADKRRYLAPGLFPNGGDIKFYQKYPTIYHLRLALMTEKRPFDLREVYLAIHHIVKYRGNFLNPLPVSAFRGRNQRFEDQFSELNQLYKSLEGESPFQFDEKIFSELDKQLLVNDGRKIDRQKQLAKKGFAKTNEKGIDAHHQKISSAFSKAVFGYKFRPDVLLNSDPNKSIDEFIKFGDEDFDDKLVILRESLNATQKEILAVTQRIYSQIILNEIVPSRATLSEAMVSRYQKHHSDLRLLTEASKKMTKDKAARIQAAYTDYIGKGDGHKLVHDQFVALIKKNLDPSEEGRDLAERLAQDDFMPLQRTALNRVIPHQLQQEELDRIIENQGEYYPFLKTLNPNRSRAGVANYQLDELVSFRIPYYVGPLITATDQLHTSGAKFAWMTRRAAGEITPWNFDQKVDRLASANQFIRQNMPKDNHLLEADVLPANSLTYQRYLVLDELNAVKVNHKSLTVSQKQRIFNDLFKRQRTVTVLNLQNYLKSIEKLSTLPVITGVSDSERFKTTLSTYLDFKNIFGGKVDDSSQKEKFEKIILYATIFEDHAVYKAKLDQIDWLGQQQKTDLLSKNYQGWGQLSEKLLLGLKNQAGQSILDELWQTNKRFREIMNEAHFAKQIMASNAALLRKKGLDDVLSTAFLSPQNKKAIRQTVEVVDDIVKAIGCPPQKISLHFSKAPADAIRHERDNANIILRTYRNLPAKMVDDQLKAELQATAEKHQVLSDKLYLYFTQLGRDLYTGEMLKMSELENDMIDHIMPQTFAYDDSVNNRVLVSQNHSSQLGKTSGEKSDAKMIRFWQVLRDNKLISEQKYQNLTLDSDHLSKSTREQLLNRYLVEKNPITQWVASVLTEKYGDNGTRVLTINPRMVYQMRRQFNLVNLPEVNDYDHGLDAYLAAFIGNYVDRRYPRLRSYFVYGDFSSSKEIVFRLNRFNFLFDLGQAEPNELTDWETGEMIWDKAAANSVLRDVYQYKFMLISQAVYSRQGAMFNQTIYPASQAAGRQLIPVKKNRATKLYGGYSGNVDAYLAIVRLGGPKSDQYRVVGIPTRMVGRLQSAMKQGADTYANTLHKILQPQFTKRKKNRQTGYYEETTEPFAVILDKVYYRQLIIDGQQKFMLGSSTYQFNAKQLVLSSRARQILSGEERLTDENGSQDLIDVYDEILTKIDRYFELYDQRHFRQSLHDGRKQFISLPIHNVYRANRLIEHGKYETLSQILNGLHANTMMTNLRYLGISSPFGKFQSPNGIKLSKDAVLVYQSPSGLFERRVRLRDL
ncbi:MAG: type II CRISPR RNA-guided endonuclease Cas9 [Lentilactobacillus diolivorans]|uniref:type II CRISPR RNA-guided endonuclease Cas9 n=1 Tax=Lentilactobacillus diolivorans TaxID=179838 RepID=UPI0039E80894